MKINELVTLLNTARDQHGDLEVVIPTHHEESMSFRVESVSEPLGRAPVVEEEYEGFDESGDCGDPKLAGPLGGRRVSGCGTEGALNNDGGR